MREEFVLKDESGEVLARRRIVYHLKPMAAVLTAAGKACTVRGEWSGLEMEITPETTQKDWRSFDDRVLEEMDACSDYFACLDRHADERC